MTETVLPPNSPAAISRLITAASCAGVLPLEILQRFTNAPALASFVRQNIDERRLSNYPDLAAELRSALEPFEVDSFEQMVGFPPTTSNDLRDYAAEVWQGPHFRRPPGTTIPAAKVWADTQRERMIAAALTGLVFFDRKRGLTAQDFPRIANAAVRLGDAVCEAMTKIQGAGG